MGYLGNVETRVLFLGEPNCGKRSLLHYFIFDQNVEVEAEEERSVAIEREKEPHQSEFIKELHLDNKTLLTHFFVKDINEDNPVFDDSLEENKYDCYVVLFDMGLWPESGNRARKLFNTISNKKKLMVGCKADLFQKTRAKRTHCVPCSVVTNYNIDNVFDQVTEILQFQDSPNFAANQIDTIQKRASVRKSVMKVVRKIRTNSLVHQISHESLQQYRKATPQKSDQTSELDLSYEDSISQTFDRLNETSEEADVDDSVAENSIEEVDAEDEIELGDKSLDTTEEKSLLNSNNQVASKQLLLTAWRQNVRNFQKVLRDLKQSGASFNICDPVNASGDTLLHELVRRPGWVAALKVLLQSNILSPNELLQLLNAKNFSGNTALHVVAGRGYSDYLEILLKANIDVMSENDRGQTVLHVAIELDQISIVERLIEFSKDLVLKSDRQGVNCYQLATELELEEISSLLHPFFPNETSPAGVAETKLIEDTKKKFFELIVEEDTEAVGEMLEGNNTLVNIIDTHGRSPLHIAVLGRKGSVIPEMLLSCGAEVNLIDFNGNTPLHWAASNPDGFYFAKFLVKNKATLDIGNKDGNLPIHTAIYSGNYKFVQYLLANENSNSYGLKKANADENTPLHIACALFSSASYFDKIVQLMTEKRAETNATNSRKEIPLHIVAATGCGRIHPSLCDKIEAKDIYGNTPLLSAARALNIHAILNLLDVGAILDATNNDNENILHLLAYRDSNELTDDDSVQTIGLLKKLERRNQNRDLLKDLLSKLTNSANETPLFYAASSNRLNLAKFYLRRGNPAMVNTPNINGDTPLHIAVQRGNRAMVDLFIRKDSKLTIQNKEGYTPLHYACHPRLNQVADRIVKKLRATDLLAVTSEGLSSLHLAAQSGNLHLVQKLVEKSQRKDGSCQLLELKTQHDNTALIYAMSNNHSKVASYLAKRQTFDKFYDDFVDRVEYRKEPFSHIYPIINQELIKIAQKLDIFSLTYNIYEGKLREDDILILEANSAASISRMSHEIAVMSMIGNHPNVQKLLGASHDNKYCYLPFLPNCGTLDAILSELMDRKEYCDTLQVLTIAEGIANGMKCLHTATVSKPAIIHCVLTPRAILIDDQNAKLSSFGSARVQFSDDASGQSDKRELPLPSMDEVRYLAPEVIRGEPPSKQSDVYSFGLILWQLSSLQIPYHDIPLEDLIAFLRKGLVRPSIDLVDPGLSTLISACWDPVPDSRPTFEEICDRLNSLHVDNVEALGRNRKLPVLRSKASPFPCCKPREFRIMNKLKKRNKEGNNSSSIYLCTFEGIVCAVKMWPPNQNQQEQMKSSLQIFTIKSLCECESVVRYIYSDTDKNGHKCLFMEYMNQGTVAQLITSRKGAKGGPSSFSPQEILHYSIPIASALKFMHKFSTVIVHQDIQAENVLLTDREGKKHIVKLGGFSAMHILQNSEEHEVYRDIEGFALYLYQLLTFQVRVKNTWKSQVQKLQLPEIYKPFINILHECLDPIERPTSAQLVDNLQALCDQFGNPVPCN